MNNKFLVMWLEAPLQSWGADSKFGRRDTLKFPTKSGVLGIILSGMGASGPQVPLLNALSRGKMTAFSFVKSNKLKEPLLRDFHMVGSGYDDKDIWQKLLIPKTSEGKVAVGGGAKLTYRYYLQDASFAIILEVPSELLDSVTKALQEPVYDIYFGRKSCVPTDFIFRGIFNTIEEAETKVFETANSKDLIEDFHVLDGEHEGDVMTINDVPIQFGEVKKYRDRRITVVQK
jgi:CRISPR system Cascade subunit CasD